MQHSVAEVAHERQSLPGGCHGLGLAREKCSSPEAGGSLDSGAALAPRAAAPLAPWPVTLTGSGSAGYPRETPPRESSPFTLQQQFVDQLAKSPRNSKRKADKDAASPRLPPKQPRTAAGHTASVGDSQNNSGAARPLLPTQQPPMQQQQQTLHSSLHSMAGEPWGGAAHSQGAPADQAPLPLDLPGLDDLDDVPALDDLLMGLAEDEPLLGDPFAASMSNLGSPWQASPTAPADPVAQGQHAAAVVPSQAAGMARPLRPPYPSHLGSAEHAVAVQHLQGQLQGAPVSSSSHATHGSASMAAAPTAAATAPVMVPQGEVYRMGEQAVQPHHAASYDAWRSHANLGPPNAASRPLLGNAGRGDLAAAAAAAAANAQHRMPVPSVETLLQQSRQQQQQGGHRLAQPTGAGVTLPVQGPSLSLDIHRLASASALAVQVAGPMAGQPLHQHQLQQAQQQQQQQAAPPALQAPVVQSLFRDPSLLQPVKRALPKPPQARFDPAKLRLSAAASLVAAAAPQTPRASGGRQLHSGADLRLLECVFGVHYPARWRW